MSDYAKFHSHDLAEARAILNHIIGDGIANGVGLDSEDLRVFIDRRDAISAEFNRRQADGLGVNDHS